MITVIAKFAASVVDIFKGEQEIKAAVVQAKIKQVKRGELSDIQLDNTSRNFSGWMDDASFGLFLLSAALCFYPPALPHMQAGFEALSKMPEWWQYGFGLMMVSVWGYRKLLSPILTTLATAYAKRIL